MLKYLCVLKMLKHLYHQKKYILNNLSAHINSNNVLSIIGESGSGKTTLLNILANRINKSIYKTSGDIHFYSTNHENKLNFAYVLQNDILNPELTVHETILFAASLNNNDDNSVDDCTNNIIKILGLDHIRNCKIGGTDVTSGSNTRVISESNQKHMISGGEKRRVSIGIALAQKPSVLFLDEPASGLCSYSALLLTKYLKKLSKNMTIIYILYILQQL